MVARPSPSLLLVLLLAAQLTAAATAGAARAGGSARLPSGHGAREGGSVEGQFAQLQADMDAYLEGQALEEDEESIKASLAGLQASASKSYASAKASAKKGYANAKKAAEKGYASAKAAAAYGYERAKVLAAKGHESAQAAYKDAKVVAEKGYVVSSKAAKTSRAHAFVWGKGAAGAARSGYRYFDELLFGVDITRDFNLDDFPVTLIGECNDEAMSRDCKDWGPCEVIRCILDLDMSTENSPLDGFLGFEAPPHVRALAEQGQEDEDLKKWVYQKGGLPELKRLMSQKYLDDTYNSQRVDPETNRKYTAYGGKAPVFNLMGEITNSVRAANFKRIHKLNLSCLKWAEYSLQIAIGMHGSRDGLCASESEDCPPHEYFMCKQECVDREEDCMRKKVGWHEEILASAQCADAQCDPQVMAELRQDADEYARVMAGTNYIVTEMAMAQSKMARRANGRLKLGVNYGVHVPI